MKRIAYDEQIEKYLDEQMITLKRLGIKNVTRPDALRFIIEQNKAINLSVKRKPKKRFGFEFL